MIMKKFTLLFCALFIINICYAQQICGVCGGRGALICSTCRGTGQVVQTFYHPYFGYQNTNVLCPSCGGGTFVACHNCGGSGYIDKSNPIFKGENSDQYILKGSITLTRVTSGIKEKFDKYINGSGVYVKNRSGRFIRVNGNYQVEINYIWYYGI